MIYQTYTKFYAMFLSFEARRTNLLYDYIAKTLPQIRDINRAELGASAFNRTSRRMTVFEIDTEKLQLLSDIMELGFAQAEALEILDSFGVKVNGVGGLDREASQPLLR